MPSLLGWTAVTLPTGVKLLGQVEEKPCLPLSSPHPPRLAYDLQQFSCPSILSAKDAFIISIMNVLLCCALKQELQSVWS